MEAWRLIEDGPGIGSLNMATDRAILQACGEGKAPPTLRLYGWKEPTLTVGYSQDACRDVDLDRCRDFGIPVVQRPTGGKALLHDRELTYSLVAPIPHARFPASLRETFRVISEALLVSLRLLGVQEAGMAKTKGMPRQGRSPSCFSALNHCEITARDKKLIGSAQRRMSRSFLQHGSLWIDCDRSFMASLFKFDHPQAKDKNLEILERHTTTLNQVCGRNVEFAEAAQAFGRGFRQVFPDKWESGELSFYELELRDEILHRMP